MIAKEKGHARIATVVASNSGRPGGACRSASGLFDPATKRANHTTQEEDIMANWVTSTDNGEEHFLRISSEYGMTDPEGKSLDTKQRKDFTIAEPMQYGEAWYVDDATLSNKVWSNSQWMYDTGDTYGTTLVFCAAPNANKESLKRGLSSSMRRTFNARAYDDKHVFRLGQAWAVYAALCASAEAKCEYVLVPWVGGGLYQGKHGLSQRDFLHMLEDLVQGKMPGVLHEQTNEVQRYYVKPPVGIKEVVFVTTK